MPINSLARAFSSEMEAGRLALALGDHDRAFGHYQRAHILGQRRTVWHLRSHWGLLRVGLVRHDLREILGQCPRLLAALLFSRLWVPVGNPGHARISAFRPVPLAPDLQRLLAAEPPASLARRLRRWG
jgi:hypothetical protein